MIIQLNIQKTQLNNSRPTSISANNISTNLNDEMKINIHDKEKLLKRLSEFIPNDADITFCTIIWWDNVGCHNASMDAFTKEWEID